MLVDRAKEYLIKYTYNPAPRVDVQVTLKA